jgi:hypothetical protein
VQKLCKSCTKNITLISNAKIRSCRLYCFSSYRKMINVHHMYNKGTIPLSHGMGPTHCGIHPMWEGCCTFVVHVMYGNHLSFVYISTPFMRTKGFWMRKKKKMVSQKVMELSCLWNMIVKAHSLIRVFLPLAHLKPWSCRQSKKLTKFFSWLYLYIYIYIYTTSFEHSKLKKEIVKLSIFKHQKGKVWSFGTYMVSQQEKQPYYIN